MEARTLHLEQALHRFVDGAIESDMLEGLSARYGLAIRPCTIALSNGTRMEVDGANETGTTIVQLVPNRGVFKSAHRNKVNADMFKLAWLRTAVFPGSSAILCVSDTVANSFSRAGWATIAAADLGIDVLVYDEASGLRVLFDDGRAEFTSLKPNP